MVITEVCEHSHPAMKIYNVPPGNFEMHMTTIEEVGIISTLSNPYYCIRLILIGFLILVFPSEEIEYNPSNSILSFSDRFPKP